MKAGIESARRLFPIKYKDLCIGDRFVFSGGSVMYTYMGIHTYDKQDYFLYKNEAIPFVKKISNIKDKTIFVQ